MTNYLLLVLTFLILACSSTPVKKEQQQTKSDRPATTSQIDIQPFQDLPDSNIQYVVTELKKIIPSVTLKAKIPLPKSAYYKARNRYRADSLIDYLSRNTQEGHITIGLTYKDISTTKDEYADWGVMGLGFCPGNACVVSTFRLSKTEKQMQLFKVAIHELGHTQGLQHCEVKSCFMRDAEGRNPTNEETEFCPKCKKYLQDKDWVLN